MTYGITLGSLRLLIGLGLLGSVAWQVTDRIINGVFRPEEYFAYFSIVSAIIVGLVLVITGMGLLLKFEDTKWVEIGRLSLATAMVIVGVVYHLLLADAAPDVRDGNYQWPVLPNEIIHTYAPILFAFEYLLSVKAFRIRLRAALWVAVYPLTWLLFSVIRGIATGWWPYWFLDPTGEIGLTGMLSYIGAITAFFLVLGFVLLAIKKAILRLTPRSLSLSNY
ncbi:MAG: Pr6Pr family membrane protein [Actinomycetota bacterium]